MRITEEQDILTEVTVAVVCDGCGKKSTVDAPRHWEHFMSGHGEWGNDSVDSCEWHDACSMRCFVEVAREVVGMYDNYSSLEVGGLNISFLKDLFLMADGKF
jgi:hypothetical protein